MHALKSCVQQAQEKHSRWNVLKYLISSWTNEEVESLHHCLIVQHRKLALSCQQVHEPFI